MLTLWVLDGVDSTDDSPPPLPGPLVLVLGGGPAPGVELEPLVLPRSLRGGAKEPTSLTTSFIISEASYA